PLRLCLLCWAPLAADRQLAGSRGPAAADRLGAASQRTVMSLTRQLFRHRGRLPKPGSASRLLHTDSTADDEDHFLVQQRRSLRLVLNWLGVLFPSAASALRPPLLPLSNWRVSGRCHCRYLLTAEAAHWPLRLCSPTLPTEELGSCSCLCQLPRRRHGRHRLPSREAIQQLESSANQLARRSARLADLEDRAPPRRRPRARPPIKRTGRAARGNRRLAEQGRAAGSRGPSRYREMSRLDDSPWLRRPEPDSAENPCSRHEKKIYYFGTGSLEKKQSLMPPKERNKRTADFGHCAMEMLQDSALESRRPLQGGLGRRQRKSAGRRDAAADRAAAAKKSVASIESTMNNLRKELARQGAPTGRWLKLEAFRCHDRLKPEQACGSWPAKLEAETAAKDAALTEMKNRTTSVDGWRAAEEQQNGATSVGQKAELGIIRAKNFETRERETRRSNQRKVAEPARAAGSPAGDRRGALNSDSKASSPTSKCELDNAKERICQLEPMPYRKRRYAAAPPSNPNPNPSAELLDSRRLAENLERRCKDLQEELRLMRDSLSEKDKRLAEREAAAGHRDGGRRAKGPPSGRAGVGNRSPWNARPSPAESREPSAPPGRLRRRAAQPRCRDRSPVQSVGLGASQQDELQRESARLRRELATTSDRLQAESEAANKLRELRTKSGAGAGRAAGPAAGAAVSKQSQRSAQRRRAARTRQLPAKRFNASLVEACQRRKAALKKAIEERNEEAEMKERLLVRCQELEEAANIRSAQQRRNGGSNRVHQLVRANSDVNMAASPVFDRRPRCWWRRRCGGGGKGGQLSCEDEDAHLLEWKRIAELQQRNQRQPAQLRSSYPVETQTASVTPRSIVET
uniref:RING-type domain-containing protein n=1 Tax=Macrostomum lignano TaxID=282301 RepID=A0A1I8FCF6_9PLAT